MQDALHTAENRNMMDDRYSDYESRPAPAGNSQLWKVHDEFIEDPTKRFEEVATSPFADTIYNTDGPLSTSVIPEGLIKFVTDTCMQFGVSEHSQYVKLKDIIWTVFRYLDHNEPYYLMVDSAVQLTTDNMRFTYRKRSNGEVFPPDRMETFKVVGGWDFKPFRALCDLISHPLTRQILSQGHAPHPTVQNRTLMKRDITMKMSQILWGGTPQGRTHDINDEDGLDAWIEDWMTTHYDHVMWRLQFGDLRVSCPSELPKIDLVIQKDRPFWKICTLAIFGWFRSPFSIKFLIEYHPIYQAVLDWDEKTKQCVVAPNSGGEAIVVDWEVYTRQHVVLAESEPPGTCGRCNQTLHCTKYINVNAIGRNDCSCRVKTELDPLDRDFYNHDYPCLARTKANFQFACQKCVNELLEQRSMPKCERVACRNTGCPHHIGMQAHVRELTRRRTLLLTQMQQK